MVTGGKYFYLTKNGKIGIINKFKLPAWYGEFTPLESPANYGGDDKINNIHLRPACRRQGGVQAPSFLTGLK